MVEFENKTIQETSNNKQKQHKKIKLNKFYIIIFSVIVIFLLYLCFR